MKKILLTIIMLSFPLILSGENSSAKISAMSHSEIDLMLKENAEANLSISDRINLYSELFLDMPYSWSATGDGPDALLEAWPLMSLDSTNCMVYCEHVLALSISDSWDNFFNNLQQIRYKDGIIGMRSRNHYTMADWLPENKWLLEDVSGEVAGKYSKKITRTISHTTFFKGKGISDLRYIEADRKITLNYVPKKKLMKIKDNLKNGDILALLYAKKDNVFSAHMMIVIEKEEGMFIRESSTSKYSTFETPYDEWAKGKSQWDRYAGIAVMRVKSELNTKNRVILPWDIVNMKD